MAPFEFGSLLLPAVAASLLFMPSEAEACSATSAVRNGIIVVDVRCAPGDLPVFPFATSYVGGSTGAGDDTLTMTGGSVLIGALDPTLVDGGRATLDASAGSIDMGTGSDVVVISGGQVGTTAAPVSIFLDSGVGLSGGTIGGTIFAGSQDDTVTISGAAHIGVAAAEVDSVGLEDGNDRFVMTDGTLDGAVSGGNGNDLIAISGGTIGSFVVGNDGTDSITISGGTIAGDVDADGGHQRRHDRRRHFRHLGPHADHRRLAFSRGNRPA
jgi:hypothetical protein